MLEIFDGSIKIIVDATKVPSSSSSLFKINGKLTGLSSSAEPASKTATGLSSTAVIVILVDPSTAAAIPSETSYVKSPAFATEKTVGAS